MTYGRPDAAGLGIAYSRDRGRGCPFPPSKPGGPAGRLNASAGPDPSTEDKSMHELNKDFTKRPPPEAPPPPVIGPPEGPAAVPAEIDPSRWEDFAVFRETFLVYVSHARYNAAFRAFGDALYEMVLESWGHWPEQTEGYLRSHLRAVVADLRH